MIIIQLAGGLGNQMFQYAFGRSLAHRLNTKLKLDISSYRRRKRHGYSLHHFRICEDYVDRSDVERLVPFSRIQIYLRRHFGLSFSDRLYVERSFDYDPGTGVVKPDTLLSGYWQSEQYFIDIGDTIRKEFVLKTVISPATDEIRQKIGNTNSVSIHVRRGDYIENRKFHRRHGICDMAYYQRAVEMIMKKVENPHFFIFSDDPEWIKYNFAFLETKTLVTGSGASKNFEDLYLMTQCRHNIIANSSFSWWGAWLNNNPGKVVMAPEQWFADKTINTTTLIPKTWLKI